MDKKTGVILTGISAACFGFLPVFASLAYRNGGNGVTLISVRFLSAAAILWIIVLLRHKQYKLGKLKIIQLFALGVFGYISATAGYFSALDYISAPFVALLFYSNPIIVCVLSFFIFKEEINTNKAIALSLSLLGLVLIVGFSIGNIHIKGVLLAVLAAFLYAGYIIASGRIVTGVDPIVATTYVVSSCAIVTIIFGFITSSFVRINYIVFIYGFIMAFFSTVVAILFLFEGIKRIGTSNAAIVSSIEPIVTVLASTFILGERMTMPQIIGGIMVIMGIMVLQRPIKPKEIKDFENSIEE
ncbi:DMT family transporter [Lutispora thermophila]|uniref:Threonine/homoserine efflux transporter RhtA n=1 Tax=Lutispora thermophila DSM 19022 TaxID=1122184 RepID=A0A1M6B1S5_9FIRM|nr:DMT family transporter [Lutispora thermophila]SHI42627.1 Threonine/homoserine efflux transporter RhtA [Lutispora thermophila DSM 19022]